MEIPKEILDNANRVVSTSMMHLMRQKNLAFDTSILLNMSREFSMKDDVTMEVKGTKLIINPEWFTNLSPDAQQWNLRHTAWHVIGFDEVRVGDKEPERWNTACDLWINSMLSQDSGFASKRPQDAAYDSRFNTMEKEDIYRFLEQNQQEEQKHQQDPMSGDCGCGEPDSGEGNGDGDDEGEGEGNQPSQGPSPEQLEKEISNMVQQAAMQAKQAGGHVPNQVNQYLDELYNPELPWNKILMKYMSAHNTYDYSYTRIHKKFFPHGIIMPSMFSEGLGHIVAANDQSGSVSDKEYEVYLGALQDIHENLNPESIRCLGFTTVVNNDTTITRDDDFNKLKFRANGGTDIPCIFEYIEREGIKPEVLIIFSDMESRIPTEKPPYDVIWISVGNSRFTAPFGRTIHVKI